MAKTTLGNMKSANPEEKSPAKKTAKREELEKVESTTEVAKIAPNDGMEGDWDQEDLLLPRLLVIAKTSELVDQGFTPGGICLNKEMELAGKDSPLEVIVLNMVKRYQEDIDWEDDSQPKVFATREEMHSEGFSTEYGAVNYCKPMANFTFLVKLPDDVEDDAGMFPHEFEGSHYAMVAFTAAKTAYATTAKVVASAVAFSKNPLSAYKWLLTSSLKSYKDNTWFSPSMKRSGILSETEEEFVKGLLPN